MLTTLYQQVAPTEIYVINKTKWNKPLYLQSTNNYKIIYICVCIHTENKFHLIYMSYSQDHRTRKVLPLTRCLGMKFCYQQLGSEATQSVDIPVLTYVTTLWTMTTHNYAIIQNTLFIMMYIYLQQKKKKKKKKIKNLKTL